MTARITAAEARRLGIDAPPPSPGRRPRRVSKGAKYHTRCKTCAEEFTTEAAEERHLISHHHPRYELVL